MGQIPTFDSPVGVPTLNAVPRSPLLAAGAAVQQIGDDFQQMADKAELEADEIEVARKTAAIQQKYAARLLGAPDTDSDNPAGFTQRLDGEFKADLDATLKGARSDRARAALEKRLLAMGGGIGEQALRFEAGAARQNKLDGIAETATTYANTARLDPSTAPGSLAELSALVGGMALPEKEKTRLMRAASADIMGGAIQAGIDRDPYAAREALRSGSYLGMDLKKLTPGLLDRALGQADQEIRRREAEARAAQSEARATARLSLGFALEDARDVQSRGGTVDVGKVQALALSAGLKPDQVTRTVQNLSAGNRAALTYTEFAGLSFADMQGETQKRVQAVATSGAAGDNANAANIEAAAAEAALARHVEQFRRDPAAYALALPAIRRQIETADTPEALARALQAGMEEQRRLAGPVFGGEVFAPQPLPQAQAASEAAALAQAAPEDKAAAFETLRRKYGPAFAPVMAQLQRQQHVDAATMAMVTVRGEAARTAVGVAFGQEPKALRAAVGAEKAKEIDGAIDEALAPLSASLSAAPNRAEIDGRYREAMKRLAYHYGATMDASAAVTRAGKDLLYDTYDFPRADGIGSRSTGRANLRVKVDPADPTRRRGDLALSVADAALWALKPDMLAAVAEGQTPLTVEQRRQVAWDNARRGTWVPTPDDNGMMLLDAIGKPVRLANGEPYLVPWSNLPADLRQLNRMRIENNRPVYGSDKGGQYVFNPATMKMEKLQ